MTKDTGNKIKRQVRNDGQFADRIRQLRLAAGLTQPQLAAKLGVTKNAVTDLVLMLMVKLIFSLKRTRLSLLSLEEERLLETSC